MPTWLMWNYGQVHVLGSRYFRPNRTVSRLFGPKKLFYLFNHYSRKKNRNSVKMIKIVVKMDKKFMKFVETVEKICKNQVEMVKKHKSSQKW